MARVFVYLASLQPAKSQPVRHSTSPSKGFTLVELLAVIAVIGVLIAILIPVVSMVRTSALRGDSVAQMRQIVAATLLYANDNRGALPDHSDLQSAWQLNATVGLSDSGYVSGKQINPYLPWMDPVWFDPLTSRQMGRAAKIAASPGTAKWVARVRYNSRLTYDWIYVGLSLPVRLVSVVRPSNALLYYNGNSSGWAGYPDQYGTVGFVDGSVRRVRDGSSTESFILNTYIAIKGGKPFPGFLQ